MIRLDREVGTESRELVAERQLGGEHEGTQCEQDDGGHAERG